MVKHEYDLVWTKRAQTQMHQVYTYISEESPKGAIKVIEDIISCVTKATTNPTMYPPDKSRIDNDGTYRAFTKHHYRISYRVTDNVIRVLRVRHSSRKPKSI